MEFRGSRNQVNKEPQHRINESIRAAQVRVVGENIEPGVYPLREALAMAEAAGMDLVEISPDADPPVCKIVDWGKYNYQRTKQQQKNRKTAKTLDMKQIRFGLKIGEHDLDRIITLVKAG